MKLEKSSILSLIGTALVVSGCMTRTIRMGDELPQLHGPSPLRTSKSAVFIINNFADERQDRETIGVVRDAAGESKLKVDRDVPSFITEAVANELARNEHTVLVADSARKPEIIIKGAVLEYWTEHSKTMWGFRSTGIVKARIEVIVPGTTNQTLTKTYVGNYFLSRKLAMGNIYTSSRDVLNSALLDMVRDFSTDPDFVRLLPK